MNIPTKEMPPPQEKQQQQQQQDESCSNSDYEFYPLHYDLEWLAILKKTHHWTNKYKSRTNDPDINNIRITQQDIDTVRNALNQRLPSSNNNETHQNAGGGGSSNHNSHIDNTRIPNDFVMTAHPHGTVGSDTPMVDGGRMIGNPQTDKLLSLLNLDHIVTVPYLFASSLTSKNEVGDCTQIRRPQTDDDEIILESESDDEGTETVCQPLSKDINLVKQEIKVEVKSSECDHDLNEIELDSDSEESDSNLKECHVKQEKKVEAKSSKCDHDLNEIELDSDSEESDNL